MLTILCLILFIGVFGSILKLALKAAWGITKIICGLVLLPILVLALIFSGIFLLAIPLLVILGVVVLCRKLRSVYKELHADRETGC